MFLPENKAEKSNVLFTALHHAREATTLTVLLRVFLVKLRELVHRGAEVHFFDLADLLFIPVVNRDAYDHLVSMYDTSEWVAAKKLRKNFNFTNLCQ